MATFQSSIDAGGVVFDDIGEADTEGGKDSGVGMDEDSCDAELGGDRAGVLWACCTEGDEAIVARVVAFGQGDGADGGGHVGVGDADKTFG